MAMYVELFRAVVNYRHQKGNLPYSEFIKLRRQIVLMNYEMSKVDIKLRNNIQRRKSMSKRK